MSARSYVPSKAVVPAAHVDVSALKGKTAVVTGGASGLGEAYVRALVDAEVHVVIGDLNPEGGERLAAELENTKHVRCNVTDWEDQVGLFQEAASFSPSGKIHYVVANAGIAVKDDVFSYEETPTKPSLPVIDINLRGTLYTAKLAMHYFIKQNGTEPSPEQEDTALILIGSGAAFLDCPRGPQYAATKFGMRGIMTSLRETAHYYGSRVNIISPWYVKTKILSEETWAEVRRVGVEFATLEDAGRCLMHLLSDRSINGRNLFLSPRKWAEHGYLDLKLDDFSEDPLIGEIQADQVLSNPPEAGLFPDGDGW